MAALAEIRWECAQTHHPVMQTKSVSLPSHGEASFLLHRHHVSYPLEAATLIILQSYIDQSAFIINPDAPGHLPVYRP